MLKSLTLLLLASSFVACTQEHSAPGSAPTTIVVTIGPSTSLEPHATHHVTSSPPGIDCTSDGTTTTGTCEMTVTAPNIVTLNPNTDGYVTWNDDSGMFVTAGNPPDGGGKSPNWATIIVGYNDSPMTHRFGVAYP